MLGARQCSSFLGGVVDAHAGATQPAYRGGGADTPTWEAERAVQRKVRKLRQTVEQLVRRRGSLDEPPEEWFGREEAGGSWRDWLRGAVQEHCRKRNCNAYLRDEQYCDTNLSFLVGLVCSMAVLVVLVSVFFADLQIAIIDAVFGRFPRLGVAVSQTKVLEAAASIRAWVADVGSSKTGSAIVEMMLSTIAKLLPEGVASSWATYFASSSLGASSLGAGASYFASAAATAKNALDSALGAIRLSNQQRQWMGEGAPTFAWVLNGLTAAEATGSAFLVSTVFAVPALILCSSIAMRSVHYTRRAVCMGQVGARMLCDRDVPFTGRSASKVTLMSSAWTPVDFNTQRGMQLLRDPKVRRLHVRSVSARSKNAVHWGRARPPKRGDRCTLRAALTHHLPSRKAPERGGSFTYLHGPLLATFGPPFEGRYVNGWYFEPTHLLSTYCKGLDAPCNSKLACS